MLTDSSSLYADRAPTFVWCPQVGTDAHTHTKQKTRIPYCVQEDAAHSTCDLWFTTVCRGANLIRDTIIPDHPELQPREWASSTAKTTAY